MRAYGDEDGKGRDRVLEGIPRWPVAEPADGADRDIHHPDASSESASCTHRQPRVDFLTHRIIAIQHLRIFVAISGLF
jgi:hypothetical protein